MTSFSREMHLIRFVLMCSLLFLAGCSMLVYERSVKTETSAEEWTRLLDNTFPHEKVRYKNNGISLTTRPSKGVGACPISIGPPIIPVIPLFFFCLADDSDLTLDFMIENSSEELSIDISNSRLSTSDDRVIPLYRALTCTANEKYFSVCSSSDKDLTIIKTSPVILNKGTSILTLVYTKIGTPTELNFKFGELSSEGKAIKVPPLKLQRSNGVAYIPFMLSGHEPVLR